MLSTESYVYYPNNPHGLMETQHNQLIQNSTFNIGIHLAGILEMFKILNVQYPMLNIKVARKWKIYGVKNKTQTQGSPNSGKKETGMYPSLSCSQIHRFL